MSNAINNIRNCFGCGLCSVVCKHNVIDMLQNEDGFFHPSVINPDKCVDCGLCVKVCSFLNKQCVSTPEHSYAAWSKDIRTCESSTSGGVSFEVAKSLLKQGYKFCGVKYNVAFARAEHYIANNIDELELSKGSKYLQSYTKTAYSQIDKKQKYFVVGTPCQIASFRRYIEIFNCSNNFILMDFFCHGVPSYLLWKKYLKENTNKLGNIKSVSWRNKIKGWHKSYCITLECDENTLYSWNDHDDFFSMFLGDACLGEACFNSCKFKYNSSAADIRIGDFWGSKYKSNDEGVCSAIAFTEKGNNVLNAADLELNEYTFDIVAEGQLKENPQKPWYYEKCMKGLKQDDKNLSNIARLVHFHKRLYGHINHLKQIIHL